MDQHKISQQQGLKVPATLLPGVLKRLEERQAIIDAAASSNDLIPQLSHPQWEVRAAAVRALAQAGREAPLAALLEALEDDHRLVRAAAVRALGQRGDASIVDRLLLALQDHEWEVREMAVFALAAMGELAPRSLLQCAQYDSNKQVREAALSALAKQEEFQSSAPQTTSPRGRIVHAWSLLRSQPPLMQKSIWYIPLAAMLATIILTILLQSNIGTSRWLLTIAILAASAVGTACLFGSENDPGLELTAATPSSMRLILLARLGITLLYNILLAALTSVLIALLHGGGWWEIVSLWLGPAVCLSSLSLALSLFLGSSLAAAVVLLLEATQLLHFHPIMHAPLLTASDPSQSLLQTNIPTLSLALLCIGLALFYAPRRLRLAH